MRGHEQLYDRTVPLLEMTTGRYYVYWSALFRLKNAQTIDRRDYARRLFRRGHMLLDPDKVVQRPGRFDVALQSSHCHDACFSFIGVKPLFVVNEFDFPGLWT